MRGPILDKSKFVNFIVTDRAGDIESFYRTERGDLIGISTVTPRPGAAGEIEFEEIQAPTSTLNDLLDQNGISKIDFLSMDIEGAEPLAVAGFDVERFKPELVCIEVNAATREPIHECFEAHGYETIDRHTNSISRICRSRPEPTTSVEPIG
jgi:FkbM family methyltransferase